MHDALLQSQQQWAHADNPQSAFADIAARIGLDQSKFIQSLQAPEEFQQRIANAQRLMADPRADAGAIHSSHPLRRVPTGRAITPVAASLLFFLWASR